MIGRRLLVLARTITKEIPSILKVNRSFNTPLNKKDVNISQKSADKLLKVISTELQYEKQKYTEFKEGEVSFYFI